MANRRQRRRHRNPLGVILRWTLLLLAVILILIAGISYAQGTVNVTGSSMYPALQPDDRALSEPVSYLVREPARGDIVQFSTGAGSGRDLVRRIVGLPGETVQIIGGKVYINGTVLDESAYVSGEIQYAGTASMPHTLSPVISISPISTEDSGCDMHRFDGSDCWNRPQRMQGEADGRDNSGNSGKMEEHIQNG